MEVTNIQFLSFPFDWAYSVVYKEPGYALTRSLPFGRSLPLRSNEVMEKKLTITTLLGLAIGTSSSNAAAIVGARYRNARIAYYRHTFFCRDSAEGLALCRVVSKTVPNLVRGQYVLHHHINAGLHGTHEHVESVRHIRTPRNEKDRSGIALKPHRLVPITYFQSVDTAANLGAVARYQARFGDDHPTNMCWEASYFQMHLLADAIRRVGSDDPTLLLRVLPGLEFDAPQGRVRIDEHNNHTYLHPLIGRVDAHGRFDIIGRAPERVKADPHVVSHITPAWTAHAHPELARAGADR
jgi:Periplasmic binding protein domain